MITKNRLARLTRLASFLTLDVWCALQVEDARVDRRRFAPFALGDRVSHLVPTDKRKRRHNTTETAC